MPATAEPPAAPAPPQTPPPPPVTLKPAPQPTAKSAQDARRDAVSSFITGLGTLAEDAPPVTEPPEKPAAEKPPEKLPEKLSPAPAAAAEPPPADEGEDKWPRSSADWKRFISVRNENYKKRDERIKALEADLKARDERLASLQGAVDPKEYESLKGERDQLSETLRLAAVERHPKFQAYYEGKTKAQVELGKRIVGSDKAAALEALLKAPDGEWRSAQLESLMAELSPLSQSRLGGVLNALEDIRTERESEITRAKDDYERALAKQSTEGKAAQEKARADAEALFESAARAASDPEKGNPLFQLRDPKDEASATWNKGVTERLAAAKSILFGSHKPDELVRHALHAVAYPALLEAHSNLLSQVEKLQTQVAELSKASPGVRRAEGAPNGAPSARPKTAPGSRPMDVARDWMGILAESAEQ